MSIHHQGVGPASGQIASANSKAAPGKRQTVPAIRARKGKIPLVVLTAYTAPMAQRLDIFCDILLVGDSLGMVVYGDSDTTQVTLDIMIRHGRAVSRQARQALVVVDMPFGSFEESPTQAFRNAARLLAESGADAVKIEGGLVMAETVAFLTARGIPVMGHVGLLPQQVKALGGFKTQGKAPEDIARLVADAKAIADAGAFSMVVEGVTEAAARAITNAVPVPTIGIGASPLCDGQVLVSDDMLGLFDRFKPRFVRHFADLATIIDTAAAQYRDAVQNRSFPGPEQCFAWDEQSAQALAAQQNQPDTSAE